MDATPFPVPPFSARRNPCMLEKMQSYMQTIPDDFDLKFYGAHTQRISKCHDRTVPLPLTPNQQVGTQDLQRQ